MEPHDKTVFASMLVEVGELYGRKISHAIIEIYWMALKNHPLEVMADALSSHMTDPDTGQFFPRPADILRHINGGTTLDQAAVAWTKVDRTIHSVGSYQTVVFDDPVIMMALGDMGSWPAICQTLEDELPFKAKEFKQLYSAYRKRPKAEYPRSLPGTLDQVNAPQGFKLTTPVLIGNAQKALAVWNGGKDIATIDPPNRDASDWLQRLNPAPQLPAPESEESCQTS